MPPVKAPPKPAAEYFKANATTAVVPIKGKMVIAAEKNPHTVAVENIIILRLIYFLYF